MNEEVIITHPRESEWFWTRTILGGRVRCSTCSNAYKRTLAGYVRKHAYPSWRNDATHRPRICPGSFEAPADLRGPYGSEAAVRRAAEKDEEATP